MPFSMALDFKLHHYALPCAEVRLPARYRRQELIPKARDELYRRSGLGSGFPGPSERTFQKP